MIAHAPWTARDQHASVIDASGAIYVIGGVTGSTGYYYPDVWVSTDGGADRTPAGGGRGYCGGYSGGTRGFKGVLSGRRYFGVLEGKQGYPRGVEQGGSKGYYGYLGLP